MTREAPPPTQPNPWNLQTAAYPRDGSEADQLAFAVRWAVLAPSRNNAQPWRFVVRKHSLEVIADRTRGLAVCDPHDRQLTIACGAALYHACLALRCFGHAPLVQLLPDRDDPDLLASVRLGPSIAPPDDEQRMLAALPWRHTQRAPFSRVQPPEELVQALARAAAGEGAWVERVERHVRAALAQLVSDGDRAQLADPMFRREFAAWLHPNRADSRDGIPGYAYGLSNAAARLEPHLMRHHDSGSSWGEHDHELALAAPLVLVLGSDEDDPAAWLRVGQALARVLLTAQAAGVAASFMNQPIEVEPLRARVAALVGRAGLPQLILRMGYGPPAKATPRRPLWQVLFRFD